MIFSLFTLLLNQTKSWVAKKLKQLYKYKLVILIIKMNILNINSYEITKTVVLNVII